jgi:hypothetical protein
MSFGAAYLACFVLGVTFVALTALLGQLGGGDHGGDGAGHDAGGDSGDAEAGGIHLPIFSPTVLAIFVGMFGASGLFFLRVLGISSPLVHVPASLAVSAASGLSTAWMMMRIMRYAETGAVASHAQLVGREAEVTISIRGGDVGEIGYEAAGTRQTILARSADGRTFQQGDRVQVLEVADGVARVGPPGSFSMLAPSEEARGTPVRTSERS